MPGQGSAARPSLCCTQCSQLWVPAHDSSQAGSGAALPLSGGEELSPSVL
jgi:hypothetical protein